MSVVSFRATEDFIEQTRSLAEWLGLKSAEYIRAAIEEKNQRMMEERMVMLSKKLGQASLKANQELEASSSDGLN